MQFSDINSFEEREFNEKNDLLNNEIDLFNDPPKGWSCICLNETINYYIDHNTHNTIEEK